MNTIGADATMRFDHEALLEGQQGQMMFSSMFMFDKFEIASKHKFETWMFSLDLPSTIKIF